MFFRQRPAENATLSYLFGCAGLGKAVAVDVVAGDEAWFIAESKKPVLGSLTSSTPMCTPITIPAATSSRVASVHRTACTRATEGESPSNSNR